MGTAPAPFALRPHERIRRKPEFQRVHEQGTRTSGRYMTALFLANSLRHDRLGIIASRRIGDAVRRNKAKRLIREMFRLSKPGSPTSGWDVVIIPRVELLEATVPSLQADFKSIRTRHARHTRS